MTTKKYLGDGVTRADRAIARAVGPCAPPTADNPGPRRTAAEMAAGYRKLFRKEPSDATMAAWAAEEQGGN